MCAVQYIMVYYVSNIYNSVHGYTDQYLSTQT